MTQMVLEHWGNVQCRSCTFHLFMDHIAHLESLGTTLHMDQSSRTTCAIIIPNKRSRPLMANLAMRKGLIK